MSQKYRIFLRRVAEKGILEGLSERALRSRFASGLPTSLIQSVQRRIAHFRLHHHHHQPRPSISHPATPTTTTTTTAISLPQLPYNPSTTTTTTDTISSTSNRASLINQVRLGQPNYFGIGTSQSHHTNYSQPTQYRPFLPAYNRNGGFLTSANALTGNQSMTMTNYATASLGVNNINSTFNFNYGSGINNINNNNERSFVPSGSSSANYSYPTSNYNHSAIQLNNTASLVPAGRYQNRSVGYTGNNNTFGLISNGSFGNNANVPAASSIFNNVRAESSAPGNISGLLPPLTQHSNNGNGKAGDDVQHQLNNNTVNSLSEREASQLDENLTDLFLMMDDMHLLNETGQNPRSELLNSDILSPFHVEQCLEQFQVPSDHVTVSTPTSEGSSINVLTSKSPVGADESSNQQLSDDVFTNLGPLELDMNLVDKANSSSGNYSAAEQDWDMELIESLFGTVNSNQKE